MKQRQVVIMALLGHISMAQAIKINNQSQSPEFYQQDLLDIQQEGFPGVTFEQKKKNGDPLSQTSADAEYDYETQQKKVPNWKRDVQHMGDPTNYTKASPSGYKEEIKWEELPPDFTEEEKKKILKENFEKGMESAEKASHDKEVKDHPEKKAEPDRFKNVIKKCDTKDCDLSDEKLEAKLKEIQKKKKSKASKAQIGNGKAEFFSDDNQDKLFEYINSPMINSLATRGHQPSGAPAAPLAFPQSDTYQYIKQARPIYPSTDSQSTIEPYVQREHAWNDDQYDMSHGKQWETHSPAGLPLKDTYAQRMNKPIYPSIDSHSEIEPYYQREHAWNDDQYDMSHEKDWNTHSPAGLPLAGTYAQQGAKQQSGTLGFMSIKEALDFYRVETDSKIIPYVIRDHAWSFDHHDKTNFYRYRDDAPEGYRDAVKYLSPHPTNQPVPPKVVLDVKEKEVPDDKLDIEEEKQRKAKQDKLDKEQLEKEKKEEDAEIAKEKAAGGKAQVNGTSAALISANATQKAAVNSNATAAVNVNASVTVNATQSVNVAANTSVQANSTATSTSNSTANTSTKSEAQSNQTSKAQVVSNTTSNVATNTTAATNTVSATNTSSTSNTSSSSNQSSPAAAAAPTTTNQQAQPQSPTQQVQTEIIIDLAKSAPVDQKDPASAAQTATPVKPEQAPPLAETKKEETKKEETKKKEGFVKLHF